TTMLTKTTSIIVIEDLNVSGLHKNHQLAQAIADVGFSTFKQQLRYAAAWYGSPLVVAGRWYPSSKTCSGCGWVDEDLALSDRVLRRRNPKRPDCALVLYRALNVALNLGR